MSRSRPASFTDGPSPGRAGADGARLRDDLRNPACQRLLESPQPKALQKTAFDHPLNGPEPSCITLMENRSGPVVQAELTHADGHGERKAALEMIDRHSPGSTRRLTPGADKGYDAASFIAALRRMVVTPHIAQKSRRSAIDGRTTHHPGYAVSQRRRKKIEEPFGWAKTVGGMAQTVHRGLERVTAEFTLTMAASNLARLPKLLAV